MRWLLIKLIKIYQAIPGPWHDSCRFQPSCSNFGIEALEKHGSIKGIILIIFRILRCNPFFKGGYYPVPEKFTLRRIKYDNTNEK